MKELKYDQPLAESVDSYKKGIEKMMKLPEGSLKLVGIHLCFAQEDGDFTTETKLWSEKEAAELFVEEA